MWKSLTGRSADRFEKSDSQGQTASNDKRSTRSRSDSIPISSSTRKSSSSKGKRSDDQETIIYNPASEGRYATTAAASVASSYATADTHNKSTQQPTDAYGIGEMPLKYSDMALETKEDAARKSKRRSRDRSSSRERRPRSISSKDDRALIDHEGKKRQSRDHENSRVHERKSSEPSLTGKTRSSRSSKPGRATTMPTGYRGISDNEPQFANTFTSESPLPLDSSYRPSGLAADYYGDQGESVADQPGVRPVAPSIILGPDTHLHEPTTEVAPPVEPSAIGQVGAAASFYASHSDQENAQQSHGNGKPAAPSGFVPYDHPSPRASPGPAPSPGSALPASSGMNGSYYSSAAFAEGVDDGEYNRPNFIPQAPNSVPQRHYGHPSKPVQGSTSHSIPPWAGVAAASDAYGLSNYGQHHEPGYPNAHGYATGLGSQASLMGPKHRHHGPLSRIVNFFKDPEAVGQYEEYTETIGVCKYCFEPGSSSRDAPRKHYYKRRLSGGSRYGSSTRVDKLNRYASSDDERRKKSHSQTPWVAAGVAGYGLAQAGKSFARRKDFDDTYSVLSGRPIPNEIRQSRRSHDQDHLQKPSGYDQTEYGIAHMSSHVNQRRPNESHSVPLYGSSEVRSETGDRHYTRRTSPHRSKPARISPRASYVSLKSEGRSGYASFFSAPSANQKDKKRNKKKKGFFTLHNSSSSSSDLDLAFDTGHVRRKNSKQGSRTRQDEFDLNGTMLGLGAATAALAAANSRSGRNKSHKADLVAVKETKPKHRKQSERHRRRGSATSESGADSVWEDASDDESVPDSNLAYGLSTRHSRESLDSNGSGTDKWAWRWGGKGPKSTRKDPRSRPSYGHRSPSKSPDRPGLNQCYPADGPTESPIRSSSLQQVYPVPTSDPTMFDVARNSSHNSAQPQAHDVPFVSQAASVPLKQPQPIVPVTSVLNGDQGSRMESFGRSPLRANTARQSSITSRPGQFLPEEMISESPPHVHPAGSQGSKNTSKRVSWSTEEPKLSQRIDTIPTDRPYESNGSVAFGRRATARERSSTVTFDLPEKEFEREQRSNRRRSERRRADSYGSDSTHAEANRSRRQRHNSHSDDEHVKDSIVSDASAAAPRRRREENFAREEELEREIRQLVEVDQSQQSGSKKSSASWVAPTAIGAAGAGFAAVTAHVMSKPEGTDKEGRQNAKKDYSETAPESSSAHDGHRTETTTGSKRRSGKIKLPRSTSSPVYDNYGSYFTPPELSEHLEEHNVASERRNSTDDRSVTIPQIVEVIPASPSRFPFDLYEPFGSRAEHNADRLYQPIPRLNLMEPSPPVSIAGSVRGDETPTIIAVEPRDEPPEEFVDATVHAKDTGVGNPNPLESMENESYSPLVDRSKKPSNFSHQPQAQTNPPSDEPMSPRTRAANQTEDIPIHTPSEDYGTDIGFAAALAAGVQDAGFDPSIVIDDPVYHKRESPPGADRGNIYQAPFAETVSELNVEARPNPLPPQIGFVEGEIESPVTKRENALKDPESLRHHGNEEKSRALQEVVNDDPSEAKERAASPEQQQAFDPKVPGDFNVFDYFEGESPAAAELTRAKQRNFDSLPADEALSRVSWSSHKAAENGVEGEDNQIEDKYVNSHNSFDRAQQQNGDGNEVERPVANTRRQEEPEDFYSSSSRKKSKRKSKRDSAVGESPHDFGDVVEEATRSQTKPKHRKHFDEDDMSVAASAPGVDEINEATRSKKKSKRESRNAKRLVNDFNDTVSIASSPAKISSEKDTKGFGKDKRSSGILSMFGAVQAPSTQKDSKVTDEETRIERGNDAGPDNFEMPKKSKKKSKKDKVRESAQEARYTDLGTISTELPSSPKDEADSFLDERPEMPLKNDTGASGPPFDSINSESDQVYSAPVEAEFTDSKPNFELRSPSASPGSIQRDVEAQSMAFVGSSSPSTPQSRNALAQRRLSALQIGEFSSHALANSSPTAIPLTFRRPPTSPGHSRHGSATSPSNESPSTPQGIVRSRQPRPNSTEFRYSKEFRPLFLVERHSYKHEQEVADTYPSLPSSRTSSAHPSIEDLRQVDHADNASKEPPEWFGQPPKGDKRHSWSGFGSQSPEYLDSQQTTPTATEFPTEIKKLKPRYEFHSPSELLQALPSQHETDESRVSPMLLPKNMSSESLDRSDQHPEEIHESSHSPQRGPHSSPARGPRQKVSTQTWKAIGFAAAAGAAGTAVAEAISSSPRLVSVKDQEQEFPTSIEEPVALIGSQAANYTKVGDDAVVSPKEDSPRESFSLQSPPAKGPKKSKKKKRKSVGFADESNDFQPTPRGSSPQNLHRSQEVTKSFVADPVHETQKDESEQPLSQDIPPLSLDTINITAGPEKDAAEFIEPEKKPESYPHDSSAGNGYEGQGSSPHVHWPEGSSAAQSLEYDPSRSTQNLADRRERSIDNPASGTHEEEPHLEQPARLLPESTPLPLTDDSDLLEPLSLEGSGASSSPLSVAFERAKAVRGLPKEADSKHQDEALPTDDSSERHRQHGVETIEQPTTASHVLPTAEEWDFTPISKSKKGREGKKTKRLPPDQSDEQNPDLKVISEAEQSESRIKGQEIASIPVSGAVEGAAAKLDTALQSEPKNQTLDKVQIESASSLEGRDSHESATESEIQDLSNAKLENSKDEETKDSQNLSQETTEESFWPTVEKKSKKKKVKGRSSSIPAEVIALQPTSSTQAFETAMSSDTMDTLVQTPVFQEEPTYAGNESKSVLEAANEADAEPHDDPIDWVPAGKKGKKGKGKQRADGFLRQPSSSLPQEAMNLDQEGSSSNIDSKVEDVTSNNLVPAPEEADHKDISPDQILDGQQHWEPTASFSSTTHVPTDMQFENLREKEKDQTRSVSPSGDLMTEFKQPDEDLEWVPTIKSKKNKKKRQTLEASGDDTPDTRSTEEKKFSAPGESPNALEARLSLLKKQSKKEKKKKKGFVRWDDDGIADISPQQPEEAAANEAASVPKEVDETNPKETMQRVVSPNSNSVVIDESLKAEPTKAKDLENDLPQEDNKSVSLEPRSDVALPTGPAILNVDRNVFENVDVPQGESAFFSEEKLASDAVYHDTSSTSAAEAADKATQSPDSKGMTGTGSSRFLPNSSVAQDVETEWPVSVKRSKKDKKKNKKQSTFETLQESTNPEIKNLPSEAQATVPEPNVDADLTLQEQSQDKVDSVESVETDWLDTMGKKSKKKKKKRQTIDWAEESSEPPMTLSAGQQAEATVHHGPSTLEPVFAEQAVKNPLSRELQDFPLETPRLERSKSILWALPAESVTEKNPTDVSEALRDEAAFHETTDIPLTGGGILPTPIDRSKNEDTLVPAEKDVSMAETLQNVDTKVSEPSDPQPTVAYQLGDQIIPISAASEVLQGVQTVKSIEETPAKEPLKATPSVRDDRAAVEKNPEADMRDTGEKPNELHTEGSLAEEGLDTFWPATSKKAKKDKKKKKALVSSTISPVEIPAEEVPRPIPQSETQIVPDPSSDVEGHDLEAAHMPDADDWNELPKKSKQSRKRDGSFTDDNTIQRSIWEQPLASPVQLGDPSGTVDKYVKQQETPVEKMSHDRWVEGEEHVQRESQEPGISEGTEPESYGSKILLAAENDIVQEPRESVEAERQSDQLPSLVSQELQIAKPHAHEDSTAEEQGKVADADNPEEVGVEPQPQPHPEPEPETISEEFSWATTPKKSKKKKRQINALAFDAESEDFGKLVPGPSTLRVQQSEVEQTAAEVDPEDFAWNVPSKKGKKQKAKTKSLIEAATVGKDILESDQPRPDDDITTPYRPSDTHAEDLWQAPAKKDKKPKKKNMILEDKIPTPSVSEDVGPGQHSKDPSESLTQDHNVSGLAPVEDDGWATSGKKSKKSKKKKQALDFENGTVEPSTPMAKEKYPLRESILSNQDSANDDVLQRSPEKSVEMATEEEPENLPVKEETSTYEDLDIVTDVPQTLDKLTGDLQDEGEAVPASIRIDVPRALKDAPTSANEDIAMTVNDTQPGDISWFPEVSRKASKKDKKKKRKTSLPVLFEETQAPIAEQEPREKWDTHGSKPPTPSEESLVKLPEFYPSRELLSEDARSRSVNAPDQEYDPSARAQSPVRGSLSVGSMDLTPMEYGQEVDRQAKDSKRRHSDQFNKGEDLLGSRNISQDVDIFTELEPGIPLSVDKRKKDKKNKKGRKAAMELKNESTSITDASSRPLGTHVETDQEPDGFKAAHYVKPSIQKAIKTLEGTQRRSSIPSQRSSSPSATRSFRDSAMQMLESPHVEEPLHQLSIDSGYIPNPVIPREVSHNDEQAVAQSTGSRPLRPITPTSSSEDLKNESSRDLKSRLSMTSDMSRPTSGQSQKEKPDLEIEVEVNPDYEVSVHRGSNDGLKHRDFQSMSSPPESPQAHPVEIVTGFPATPIRRKPSQIDSTSKDRSSGLFDSSPSLRTPDPSQTPQSNRKNQPIEASGLHRSSSVHSRRSAELLKQRHEHEAEELEPVGNENYAGQESPLSRQSRSIFGGPFGNEPSDQKGISPPRMTLRTIPEDASSVQQEKPHNQGKRPHGSSLQGSTESLRLGNSWPKLDQEHEAAAFSPQQPSKPIGGEPPATPEDSEDESARDARPGKGAKGLGKRASFADLRDANFAGLASSSTRDPVTGTGNEATREMADSYDGWGANPGSPMSPTRPPSMRKRQSMQQIQDLQAKVEQLASENRLLASAKITAEKNLEDYHFAQSRSENASQEASEVRELKIREQDEEIHKLKESFEWVQNEVARLKEMNDGLTATNVALTAATTSHDQKVSNLKSEHSRAQEQWRDSSRELEDLRAQHEELSTGMEGIVRHEIEIAVADRDAEIKRLNSDLELAKGKIRELQQQLLAGRSSDELFTPKDADYFEAACQQLCQHVQAWVKRFSKYSDTRVCRLTSEVKDEQIVDRFENAMLDDYDVNKYLTDRVKRRDVFMSVVMEMIWNHVFTRYLFGMDREQRQKLKSLEKVLTDIGPPSAVRRWRSLTLTLLTQRESFKEQRAADSEAVVLDIYRTLAKFLPPPSSVEGQVLDSLRNVMKIAVDLSIEMRKQRAEYTVLPPLQPEYDTNGDLAQFVYFNATLMNERSGETTSNEALESQQAIVRVVLFPLVVKKGSDNGEGDEEFVVCPAQVLIAKPGKDKKVVRIQSGDKMSIDGGNRSVHSCAPSSMDLGNVI
ncbi:MAG: hypothetical protein Q9160_007545 [Pyrenula sp. 1 TL-2023]